MKTIKNFLALVAIILISSFVNTSSTYARDDIDWSDLEIKYSYDYSDEQLDIKVWVDENTRPDDRYSARIKIDGDTYYRDFSYNSSSDELYFEYSINIDDSDIEYEYDLDIRVTNESRNYFEYEDEFTINVENYMDWDDLEMSNEYNWSSQYLRVELTLDDIETSPNQTHYSYLKLDGKTHTAVFRYSSSDDKYYATHTIYIDRDDIDDDYNYDLTVKDRNYKIVYEDDGELIVDENYSSSNSSKSSSIDWSDMTVSNYYNPTAKELNVIFMVPDVRKYPSKNYFVVLTFNGREYTKKLTYLDDQDRLYASITLAASSLREYYPIDFEVISSNSTVYSRENVRMNINRPGYSNTTSYTPVVIKKYNTDSIAQKIIDIAEERYTYSADKIYYLERVTNKLDNFFGTNSQERAVVTGVNNKLKQQIQNYKQTQYYEEELFDFDESDFYWR